MKNKIIVQKLKKINFIVWMLCALFVAFAFDAEAATVESHLANVLPKYPDNGQGYWVVFREGYRNSRIELTTCDIDSNMDKAYIKWGKSLTLQGSNASGRFNQYKLSENGIWEQIGTYGRFTDYATSIIASNLDIYDSYGNLIYAKSNLNDYPKCYGKKDINKAKVQIASKWYYTGNSIKPLPKITYDGKYLYNRIDYSLLYKNNKKVGNAFIIIKGKGEYEGTKTIRFIIVKKPKASLQLSKKSVTLSLAGARTYVLKATKNKTSYNIKWKSSDTSVATVKNGKITARKCGTARITASVGGATAICKVSVKDTATRIIKLSFETADQWSKKVKQEETSLVFGGTKGVNMDGSTYYTGNIIVKRQILSYKKIKVKVSLNTPGHYKSVYVKFPNKIKYTLHRHNLTKDLSSESVGKIMAGLVKKQIVWTQKCGCGLENVLVWEIPLEKIEKLTKGKTYSVNTN